MTDIILIGIAILILAIILLWPQPSDAAGDWFRRAAWRTVSSDYSGTYQENSITGARRYVESTVWETGRPHAPPDRGWLDGLPFGVSPDGKNPLPPPPRPTR